MMSEGGGADSFALFAELIEQLALTSARRQKLALIGHFLGRGLPDSDKGYALAVLTGQWKSGLIRTGQLKGLVVQKVDARLFELSYAYVGDLAETISLIWPDGGARAEARTWSLTELIECLEGLSPLETRPFVDRFLSAASPVQRWAFVKLVTGSSLRVGVSARLAKQAFADWSGRDLEAVERYWSADVAPYVRLFEWAAGGDELELSGVGVSNYLWPPLLACPVEAADFEALDPGDFVAEWKFDGVRVQWHHRRGLGPALFSRTGEAMLDAFSEFEARFGVDVVLDGELLVRHQRDLFGLGDGGGSLLGASRHTSLDGLEDVADFGALQRRLGRKSVSAALLESLPAILCCYDLLWCDGEDLRGLPYRERRERLEALFTRGVLPAERFRLSPRLSFTTWEELAALRGQARDWGLEGVMLKSRESRYVSGRPKGLWYKWKFDPLQVDAVLLYAQRGHGRRASFYSDFAFGVWDGGKLVTVGKAYFGFTDDELKQLDAWVRAHTTERFGASVRAVEPELVLEIAFDSIQYSERHKSGVAMRFPRIHRIRWDKPASEANHLRDLQNMV